MMIITYVSHDPVFFKEWLPTLLRCLFSLVLDFEGGKDWFEKFFQEL